MPRRRSAHHIDDLLWPVEEPNRLERYGLARKQAAQVGHADVSCES